MALSELDRKFDAVLAAVTGPDGRVILDRDEQGRTIVANFPPTLPLFFKTFCALYADVEAVIAGDERLTFGQLDTLSDQMARGLAARGIGKGDRVGIAMRPRCLGSCPHGRGEGGSGRDPAHGAVAARRAGTALQLTDPKLVLADARVRNGLRPCNLLDRRRRHRQAMPGSISRAHRGRRRRHQPAGSFAGR